ncbi:uncharacterized protein LOC144442390 [Glandiceps talaboti]
MATTTASTGEEIPSDVKLVLVTGASGFIASHVTQQLLRAGYRVRGTVRSLKNEKKVQPLYNLCPDSKHKLELVEADLLDPDGWKKAVEGCSHVLHIASPFPASVPKDENEVIKPAVEGTTNVLKACQQVGGVKRVVVTSSVVAISGNGISIDNNHIYTEDDWPNPDMNTPYEKSKIFAEKAAWDFVENLKDDEKFELATINPGFVIGPVLSGTSCTSAELPTRLLNRDMPLIPKISLPMVDVRDVAAAHMKAMMAPEAVGHRHIVVAGNIWFKDAALAVEKEFKPQGYSIPTLSAPKIALHIYALFDDTVKYILPTVGKISRFNTTRMKDVLAIQPISMEKSLIDMCYSIIEGGIVRKRAKYRGPPKSDGETKCVKDDENTPPTAEPANETGAEATAEPATEAVTGTEVTIASENDNSASKAEEQLPPEKEEQQTKPEKEETHEETSAEETPTNPEEEKKE